MGVSVQEGTSAPCTPPTALGDGSVPADFPLKVSAPADAMVVTSQSTGGLTQIEGVSTGTVQSVFDHWKGQLAAAGAVVDSEDYEGREAEIFFTAGPRTGAVLISKARCPRDTTGFAVNLRGS